MAAPDVLEPGRQKNTFILCFDGTGNKFSGTEADSNILKLYRMLDRSDANTYTFYQPGIGTYITSSSMQTTTMVGRVRSAYLKAKDSAVGSSFAEHVMGGYKFLMRYYSCEDDLYFFGFSRGAYTARFLAEMLDHIGLLSAGNEELIRFAWKTYAKWASRKNDGSQQAKEDEAELYRFMTGFRETFSRPVRRIRFIGLFDTVNSVPRFESAWMQRSKFPYTARSSAKVIRHAVAIDERRAKFRQDLISGSQKKKKSDYLNENIHRYNSDLANMEKNLTTNGNRSGPEWGQAQQGLPTFTITDEGDGGDDIDYEQRAKMERLNDVDALSQGHGHDRDRLDTPHPQRPGASRTDSHESYATPVMSPSMENVRGARGSAQGSFTGSRQARRRLRRRWSDRSREQDIEEVWFAGGHADIGGGWSKQSRERWMLSHIPLVWMVHEAEKAGLAFDQAKMARLKCLGVRVDHLGNVYEDEAEHQKFLQAIQDSYSGGLIHDCLNFSGGLPRGSVIFWKFMEYLPFRRMDLTPDGSWNVIRWPLPMGETRDIPTDAKIHHTVIKRMQADSSYRPGNLIIGGGGRGVRTAGEEYGIGEWDVHKYDGDHVRENYVRRHKPEC